ncbi:helix-turn-helix domain-containing protein [Pseudonocardia sp. RS11V-5]|uniref:helix-turn-helix domain-containing protein n=1 Tax=Pseudonocardia terrae TaxID=2905831 RepID=UPI001E3862DD|nr:helix-turn-helix domain-containing protein [Pseudonocardia terrae]MCE3555518.1 helix-turn-helix domain-containing protein [Pseudonocardia terrae]
MVELVAGRLTRLTDTAWQANEGGCVMTSHEELAGKSLAERIDHLIQTVHPADRGPYTLEEISDGIRAQGGPSISAAYLNQLHRGKRDNPTKLNLEAIARFFGVPVAYFFDDTEARAVDEEIALLQAIRDQGIKDIALRTLDLSPETRQSIVRIIQEMSDLEQRTGQQGRRRRRRDSGEG